MGRPKLDDPKTVMSVRVPRELALRVDRLAKSMNVKRGDLLRRMLEFRLAQLERRHLRAQWVDLIASMDAQKNCGDLVPVQAIRDLLPDYDDVDAELLQLEDEKVLRLKQGDPSLPGIDVPGRGTVSMVKLVGRRRSRRKTP